MIKAIHRRLRLAEQKNQETGRRVVVGEKAWVFCGTWTAIWPEVFHLNEPGQMLKNQTGS